jgi:hypothetical protein
MLGATRSVRAIAKSALALKVVKGGTLISG